VTRLIFHPAAEAEVREAAAFYQQRRRGLGGALRREVDQALHSIRRNPVPSPRFEGTEYRFLVLRRFPYVVFYEILGDRIHILAHGRRQPGYWLVRGAE